MNHPRKIRVLEPLISLSLFGIAVFYFINVLNTGSWVWFRSQAVNIRPSRIVIVNQGERTVLSPGHSDFIPLSEAIETSLSKLNNTGLVGIGLSEQTLADYAAHSLILELYFDQPVVFHSMARTGEPTQLLIPISGRHAQGNYVFRGSKGEWWYGAVRMANPTPLRTMLQNMGYQTANAGQPAG